MKTNFFTMECQCGHPNCPKLSTEDDWQLPYLQRSYDGYFQCSLQEKINARKIRQ